MATAQEFDPAIPLASAVTPPSGWYTDPEFLRLELDRVFLRGWQAVGHIGQVKNPNDFFTGSMMCKPIISVKGWTYGLDGTLLKATRISGIKNFNKNVYHNSFCASVLLNRKIATYSSFWKQDFGLLPIKVATWGPFVLARFDDSSQDTVDDVVGGDEWLGSASDLLSRSGIDTSLPHICRREYIIECNWKVFCDNYLDGGYHVPYAHGALASVDSSVLNLQDDQDFIDRSLKDSEQVQIEDIALCEGVQRGLESPAYGVGRYAPSVEMAMHHFHCLLHANLSG
ncbi:Choline monooxygenase, chloroplastic [Triticum urartu]|uniref:Choline monooxygenase, chloroplastic n=1 Tax=Triticum urartu TaxID=4572 RepID=M7YJG9_TRIUA|nr:Choline monooxygenase, chloroplastic [Triticum urartu]